MGIMLSVVIVNFNGEIFLENCIKSLSSNLQGLTCEIIVVDNNSTDNSCNFIKKNFPEIRLIESAVNYGFGRGNNIGVAQALGEYILLLNNDTVILSQISPLLDVFKLENKIGAVGARMIDAKKSHLASTGDFPRFINMLRFKYMFDIHKENKYGKSGNEYYEVDWVAGSFIIIPKEIYTEIGGFDEDYFLYVEDVDLNKRIADKGYKRLFFPKYEYIHLVGFNSSKNPMIIKGYRLYIAKHFTGLNKCLLNFALNINAMVKNLKA